MVINEKKDLYKLKKYVPIIIMLPFAGGNTYSYKDLIKFIYPGIDVLCPELPGRGFLSGEPLISDMEQLSDHVFDRWLRYLPDESRYIIYGHSMGALLGLLLIHKIKNKGMKLPEQLIVSGRKGPGFLNRDNDIHALPSDMFKKKIKEMGGTLDDILENKELMDYFEPILRSDITAVETFKYVNKEIIDTPVSVWFGADEQFCKQAIISWQKETNKPIKVREMSGNHFFIFDHAQEIANHLSQMFL